MAEKLNYRDEIANEIIQCIEDGTAPWQQPWKAGALGAAPFNPVSGKPYRGINDIWLSMKGHADPRWMTYRQASEAGAQVRKGERSSTIEYWQWSQRVPVYDADGVPVLDENGIARMADVRLDRPRVFYAKVFNAEQIDGLEPWTPPAPTFNPIERAEAIIAGSNVPVLHDQRGRAFYRPMSDDIHLPPMGDFTGAAAYYETVLHELGHATGHTSRLDRAFGPFGGELYAREELRAEIASFMLARELGIGFDPSNHAAYVESWLKALREDRNEIFHAARDAETIKTWVLEPEQRQALEQTAHDRSAARERTTSAPEQAPAKAVPETRTYLTVPFAEKDRAKAAGARWDREAKSWYVPEGIDPAAFAAWMAPARAEAATPERDGVPSQAEYTRMIDEALATDVSRSVRYALYEAECAYFGREPATGALDLSTENFAASFQGAGLSRDVVATLLQRADIAANWPARAAETLGLGADTEAVAAIANDLPRLDWSYSYSDDAEVRSREAGRIRETIDAGTRFAQKSPLHAEFVSALWDQLSPRDDMSRTFPGYVPASERANAFVGELAADPLAATFAARGMPATFTKQSQEEQQVMAADRQSRVYLDVPFTEKDRAKAAGARWDRNAKSWYVPEGVDATAFGRWIAAPEKPLAPREEFAEALKAHGLQVAGVPVMDGEWHRVSVEGDRKGQMSGSYRGFLDGRPSGQITNYKAGGGPIKWVATGVALTDAARAKIRVDAVDVAARREAQRIEAAEAAAKVAYGVWTNLPAAATPENCPYLKRKGVLGHGVKVDGDGHLVVPARDASGRLWTLQFVRDDGKRFLKESAKAGRMHAIETSGKGTLDTIGNYGSAIVIAEGYATASTLHEASGRPVVVAFDSGNLLPIARAVRAAWPDHDILIAADNDHANKLGNVGMTKGEEAAKAVGGKMFAPDLNPDEKAKGLTDFNDLGQSRGRAAVLHAVEAAEAALHRARHRDMGRSVA